MIESRYLFSETYCGGYSGEDPPLPIPNREVKLTSADGTAPPGGRVGSCHFSHKVLEVLRLWGLFFMRKAPAQMRHRRICLFQPLSAKLTSPFRGMPTARCARVGRPRCCDVLRTSCWRGWRSAEAPLYVFGGANANSGIQLRLTSFKQDYTVLSYVLSYVKVPAYKRSIALISRRWSAFGA